MCIGHHVGEALGRVGEVYGEVGGVGFEDAEQRHDEVGRALHTKAHDAFVADAEGGKMRGDGVRAGVEFGVGQARLVLHESDGVWRAAGLLGEERVQRLRLCGSGWGGVPLVELCVFLAGEHGEICDARGGILGDGLQQRAEVAEGAADGGFVENGAIILRDEP